MFIYNKKNNDQKTTIKIITNITIKDLLGKIYRYKEFPLCPVYALDHSKKNIDQELCINCGICWLLNQSLLLNKKNIEEKFIKYCKNERKFFYRWLSTIVNENIGLDINIQGYSRNKRIPFVAVFRNKIVILKTCKSIKDIEKYYFEMEDINKLLQDKINNYQIIRAIVLFEDNKNMKSFIYKFNNFKVLNLHIIINLFFDKKNIYIDDCLELGKY